MSRQDTLIAQLKSAQYLELREIQQAYDGPLRLVVEEHRVKPEPQEIDGSVILAYPIERPSDGKVFQLRWHDYVSFSVTGDEYPPHDNSLSGINSGYFQEGPASDFLAYIREAKSQLFDIHERHLKNWTVITLNCYVDIVSYSPLEITLL